MLDFPTQKPSDRRSLEEYLAEKIREIVASWGTRGEIYLDFSRYEPDVRLPNGQHIIDYIFDIARQSRLQSLPVAAAPISLRGPGIAYFQAVSRVIARDRLGLAVRVPFEYYAAPGTLEQNLEDVETLVGAARRDIDVYLDAEALDRLPAEARSEGGFAKALKSAVDVVTRLGYRRVVFAASSLPELNPKKGVVLRVPREDFLTWRNFVRDNATSLLRFGDYGVIYPLQTDSDKPVRPPSRVRITTESEYVSYKGDRSEIRTLSKAAIADGILNDAVDCWGATALQECAIGNGSIGGPAEWVARDTNIHIENTVAAMIRHVPIGVAVLARIATIAAGTPWLQDSLLFPTK